LLRIGRGELLLTRQLDAGFEGEKGKEIMGW
jgi:hypothetical protein